MCTTAAGKKETRTSSIAVGTRAHVLAPTRATETVIEKETEITETATTLNRPARVAGIRREVEIAKGIIANPLVVKGTAEIVVGIVAGLRHGARVKGVHHKEAEAEVFPLTEMAPAEEDVASAVVIVVKEKDV